MAWRLRAAVLAAAAGSVLVAAPAAVAAWASSGAGSATAKAGYWAGTQLRWTGPASTACVNATSCTLSIGNNANFTTKVQVTDPSGNVMSNIGSGKTVTLSIVSNGSGGGFTTSTTLTLPATGAAVTTASFTYKSGAGGSWTDNLKASASGYADATVALTK
ncbi:MAG TPA: hypothetical protein VJT31_29460 [Rugosimonospora sp.]|nr:hypothetical protein [Rugosimonospora sp.]